MLRNVIDVMVNLIIKTIKLETIVTDQEITEERHMQAVLLSIIVTDNCQYL